MALIESIILSIIVFLPHSNKMIEKKHTFIQSIDRVNGCCVCIGYLRLKPTTTTLTHTITNYVKWFSCKITAVNFMYSWSFVDHIIIIVVVVVVVVILLRVIVSRNVSSCTMLLWLFSSSYCCCFYVLRWKESECKGNSIQAHFLYSFIYGVVKFCSRLVFCIKHQHYSCYVVVFFLFYSWNLIQLVFLGNGHTIIIQENIFVCCLTSQMLLKRICSPHEKKKNTNENNASFLLFSPNECDQMIVLQNIRSIIFQVSIQKLKKI